MASVSKTSNSPVTSKRTVPKEIERALPGDRSLKSGGLRRSLKKKARLICAKHNEKAIKFYCRTHDVGICHQCGTNEHQKPCHIQEIDYAVTEFKRSLADLKADAEDRTAYWRGYGARCKNDATRHLKSLGDSISFLFQKEFQKEKEILLSEEAIINQEAEEEILKINQKREAKLKTIRQDAKERRKPIEAKQTALFDDLKIIKGKTFRMLDNLQRQAGEILYAIRDAAHRIETLMDKEEELMNGAYGMISRLSGALERTTEGYALEFVTETLQGMAFEEGPWKEQYNGRIIGYHGKWDLDDTLSIPEHLKHPAIVGLLNDDEVIFTCVGGTPMHTYLARLKDKKIAHMIASEDNTCVSSCVLRKPYTLVCGKYQSDTFTNNAAANITLRDVKNGRNTYISMPKSTPYDNSRVDVEVDKKEMIIASESGSCRFHVIDGQTGKILSVIQCLDTMKMLGVLSSGEIVARPSPPDNTLYVVDRGGGRKVITTQGKVWCCGIHPVTDDLYPMYWDVDRKMHVINRLSSDGGVIEKDVVISPLEPEYCSEGDYSMQWARIIITSSGKLIVCNGKKIIVYAERS